MGIILVFIVTTRWSFDGCYSKIFRDRRTRALSVHLRGIHGLSTDLETRVSAEPILWQFRFVRVVITVTMSSIYTWWADV